MLFLNNKLIEPLKYPNNEIYIDINTSNILTDEINTIELKFEDNSEFLYLVLLKDNLDSRKLKTRLYIPYLPYSRMDRAQENRIFSLSAICRLINSLHFEEVIVFEPHSEVTERLLEHVKVINMTYDIIKKYDLLNELKKDNKDMYIVYPDKGAFLRYSGLFDYDKIIVGEKERDFQTGFIKGVKINEEKKEPFDAIIVDDLCSKGGTFNSIINSLLEIGAQNIYLVVTHCEDTIFEGKLLNRDELKKIYTTNSILSKLHQKIKIIDVFTYEEELI